VQGFLNLNKPSGFTSHDCVAKVRGILRLKRVGHGGTLDPAATGVLPIALGRATRLLQFLSHDKAYRATIRFGLQTTTDDLEGEPLQSSPVPGLTLEMIQEFLPQFQGKIEQIPPRYSAIQVQGKRLYDLAREGKAIDIPIRSVEVYDIQILDWRSGDFPELEVAIACGTGTYIRSIARDLGDRLKTGGTLAALTRTLSSDFALTNSITLDQLTEQVQQETFEAIAPEAGLQHLPNVILPIETAQRWCQGQRTLIPTQSIEESGSCRVHDESGRFLGVGEAIASEPGKLLVPQVVLG
jgi:tRNA pseudouridine55 synthase